MLSGSSVVFTGTPTAVGGVWQRVGDGAGCDRGDRCGDVQHHHQPRPDARRAVLDGVDGQPAGLQQQHHRQRRHRTVRQPERDGIAGGPDGVAERQHHHRQRHADRRRRLRQHRVQRQGRDRRHRQRHVRLHHQRGPHPGRADSDPVDGRRRGLHRRDSDQRRRRVVHRRRPVQPAGRPDCDRNRRERHLHRRTNRPRHVRQHPFDGAGRHRRSRQRGLRPHRQQRGADPHGLRRHGRSRLQRRQRPRDRRPVVIAERRGGGRQRRRIHRRRRQQRRPRSRQVHRGHHHRRRHGHGRLQRRQRPSHRRCSCRPRAAWRWTPAATCSSPTPATMSSAK